MYYVWLMAVLINIIQNEAIHELRRTGLFLFIISVDQKKEIGNVGSIATVQKYAPKEELEMFQNENLALGKQFTYAVHNQSKTAANLIL